MNLQNFAFDPDDNRKPGILSQGIKNLWTRMMYFRKAGDFEETHSHNFDHLTLLTQGSIKVIVNEKETICEAPMQIYLKAGLEHKLIAMEDDTMVTCVHALKNADGTDLLDPKSIPEGVTFTNDEKIVHEV